jgi:hypothetical protein
MLSNKKLDANRRNAKLSTGPKTPEGKARVANNARKHSLTSVSAVVTDEEREAFQTYANAIFAELDPKGILQEEFATRVVHSGWNLKLARRIEGYAAILAAEFMFGGTSNDPEHSPDRIERRLVLINRYRESLERTFNKALGHLRELATQQHINVWNESKFDRRDAAPTLDLHKIAKQTHDIGIWLNSKPPGTQNPTPDPGSSFRTYPDYQKKTDTKKKPPAYGSE